MSLADAVALGNDDTIRTLDRTAHVGLQFRAMYLAVFMDGIDLAVVVEEHAEVVDIALHVVVRPRPFDVLRGVTLQALSVDVGEYVELPIGVADAGCPDALSVNFLMVLQGELVFRKVEAVEAIGGELPVHQVLRMKNHQAGHGMHGGASQVVVVTHTDDVRVRELVVEQRISKRAVAIIGSPRLRLCHCAHGAKGQQGSD